MMRRSRPWSSDPVGRQGTALADGAGEDRISGSGSCRPAEAASACSSVSRGSRAATTSAEPTCEGLHVLQDVSGAFAAAASSAVSWTDRERPDDGRWSIGGLEGLDVARGDRDRQVGRSEQMGQLVGASSVAGRASVRRASRHSMSRTSAAMKARAAADHVGVDADGDVVAVGRAVGGNVPIGEGRARRGSASRSGSPRRRRDGAGRGGRRRRRRPDAIRTTRSRPRRGRRRRRCTIIAIAMISGLKARRNRSADSPSDGGYVLIARRRRPSAHGVHDRSSDGRSYPRRRVTGTPGPSLRASLVRR